MNILNCLEQNDKNFQNLYRLFAELKLPLIFFVSFFFFFNKNELNKKYIFLWHQKKMPWKGDRGERNSAKGPPEGFPPPWPPPLIEGESPKGIDELPFGLGPGAGAGPEDPLQLSLTPGAKSRSRRKDEATRIDVLAAANTATNIHSSSPPVYDGCSSALRIFLYIFYEN
jgi:hypothetical protein